MRLSESIVLLPPTNFVPERLPAPDDGSPDFTAKGFFTVSSGAADSYAVAPDAEVKDSLDVLGEGEMATSVIRLCCW